MSTFIQKRLALLGFTLVIACAPLASAAVDAMQELSGARALLKLGETSISEVLLVDAIKEFSKQRDFRGMGEAQLEYASLIQTKYIANAASASELQRISAVQAGYVAKAASAFEYALASLVADEDNKAASEVYFLLAGARARLSQSTAACMALAQSLDYHIEALAQNDRAASFERVSSRDIAGGAHEVLSKSACRATLAGKFREEVASR